MLSDFQLATATTSTPLATAKKRLGDVSVASNFNHHSVTHVLMDTLATPTAVLVSVT